MTRTRLAHSLAACWMAVASTAGPAAATPQSSDLRSFTRDTILDNGLHVIGARNSRLPLATIEIVVRGGALAQTEPEDEGIPHILEHMLFKSFDRSGRDWWAERTSELGATYNGTTGEERVTYYLTLPADNVDKGIELLADLVRSPRFEKRTLEAEKFVVRGELDRNLSDPYFVAEILTDLALWGEAYPQKNAIGNVVTILAVTTQRLERHYEKYYVPNNMALVVTGNVDPDDVFDSARRHFGGWRRRADPFADFKLLPITPLFNDSVFVIEADASDVTFTVRWLGPPGARDRESTYATALFAALLNLPTSPTQRRLVDSGLFSFVSAGYQHVNQISSITLGARSTPGQVQAASRALREELDLIARPDYFDAADLEAAIKGLRLSMMESQQTTSGLAHSLAGAWSVAGIAYYLGYVEALERQTPSSVRESLSRYVYGRPKVVSILLSADAIQENAEALGASLADWRRP